MKKKWKKGESLIEALAAILVCALTATMLIAAVMAGKAIVDRSSESITTYRSQIAYQEELISTQKVPQHATKVEENIKIINPTASVNVLIPVTYYRYSDSKLSAYTNKPTTKRTETCALTIYYRDVAGNRLRTNIHETVVKNEDYHATAPEIYGHTFVHWVDSNNCIIGTGAGLVYVPGRDTSVTAVYN